MISVILWSNGTQMAHTSSLESRRWKRRCSRAEQHVSATRMQYATTRMKIDAGGVTATTARARLEVRIHVCLANSFQALPGTSGRRFLCELSAVGVQIINHPAMILVDNVTSRGFLDNGAERLPGFVKRLTKRQWLRKPSTWP